MLILTLCFGILVGTYPQKSHALIGVLAKSKTVRTIGGVTALSGLTVGSIGIVGALTAADLGGAILGIVALYLSVYIAGIGLIILDDQTVANIDFKKIQAKDYPRLDPHDVAIYNREVKRLNMIKEDVQADLNEGDSAEKAGELWKGYAYGISEETQRVAAHLADLFVKNLSRR